MAVKTLENKIKQNKAFARGFLEGFFGPAENCHAVSSNIRNALHWLDGWVEGNSQRVSGAARLPSCFFNDG